MCEVKVNGNGGVSQLIKKLKQIDKDGLNIHGDHDLARLLAEVNKVVVEFSDYEKKLKKELLDRDIKPVYEFDDLGSKVFQTGRSFTNFDVLEIGKEFQKAKRLDDFFKIVDIKKTWLDEHIKDSDPMRAVVYTRSVSGKNSYVTVAKLKPKK